MLSALLQGYSRYAMIGMNCIRCKLQGRDLQIATSVWTRVCFYRKVIFQDDFFTYGVWLRLGRRPVDSCRLSSLKARHCSKQWHRLFSSTCSRKAWKYYPDIWIFTEILLGQLFCDVYLLSCRNWTKEKNWNRCYAVTLFNL